MVDPWISKCSIYRHNGGHAGLHFRLFVFSRSICSHCGISVSSHGRLNSLRANMQKPRAAIHQIVDSYLYNVSNRRPCAGGAGDCISTDRWDNILIGTCHMHMRLNEATVFEAYKHLAVCVSQEMIFGCLLQLQRRDYPAIPHCQFGKWQNQICWGTPQPIIPSVILAALVESFGARCTHAWRTSCANQLVSHVVLVAGISHFSTRDRVCEMTQ